MITFTILYIYLLNYIIMKCSSLLVDYRKLSLPAIIIFVIGDVISFLLAFNFYPEKHVNVMAMENVMNT